MKILILALLFLPFTLGAKELPEMPKAKQDFKYQRRIFLVGVGLLGASKAADAWTTRSLLDRGGWENNPVFGRYPSASRQAGINALAFAGQAGLFYVTEHNRQAWVRWAGRAYIGLVIFDHVRLAACNSKIDTHSPVPHNCHALF